MWFLNVMSGLGRIRHSRLDRPIGRVVRRQGRRALRLEMLEHRHLLSIDLVSAAASGEIGNAGGTTGHTGDTAYNPAVISTDGRYVAFTSGSTNLVENDANGQTDVFVKDLQTGTVTLVSVTSTGVQGDKK